MHHALMCHVAVGEYHLLDGFPPADELQIALVHDRNAVWIARSGQRWRIVPVARPGDLGLGEGDDLALRSVAVDNVEVVEIAARGAQDDYATGHARHHRAAGRAPSLTVNPPVVRAL